MLQWNCRSIGNKDSYLSLLVNIHRPSVICLQETRLQDQPDPTVLKHYHPYRRYEGHGVAIYIHKTLTQTEVTLNTPLEAVACRVRFNNTYLAICSLYLPPNAPIVDDNITSLFSQLPGNRLVLGNFNARHQQWVGERSGECGEEIVNIILICHLNNGNMTRVDDLTGNAPALICHCSRQIYLWLLLGGHQLFPQKWASSLLRLLHKQNSANVFPDWATLHKIGNVDISGEDTDTMVSTLTQSILHAT